MVAIQKLRLLAEQNQKGHGQAAAAAKMYKKGDVEEQKQKAPPAAAASSSCALVGLGQNDWEAVRARLEDKVLRLERCKPMFMKALGDLRISVWLPRDTHIVRHVKHVVGSLLPGMRFKIGVTVDPDWRYYLADYAYCKPKSMERDDIRYEGMIIVYAHPVRDVVCVFETCVITLFKDNILFKDRIANKKEDFDNHIPFDHSDEESEAAAGPHVLYISWGVPFYKTQCKGRV
jgi:hypothetical protein